MTAILTHGLPSILPPSAFDHLPDGSSDSWCSLDMSPLPPMAASPWPESYSGPMSGGMHDMDLRMFHSEAKDYESSIHGSSGSFVSPDMGYLSEPKWGSDIDMATPSTGGFASESLDAYLPIRSNLSGGHHLSLPTAHDGQSQFSRSPQSSSASPMQQYAKPYDIDQTSQRPAITRSVTAPEHPSKAQRQDSPMIKRSGSAELGEDDDFAPSEEAKRRGRKRQRIPHTAVERRYRENLNAHLDRLRQNVPSLSSKRTPGCLKAGGALGEGVKPSKCEILNGAIEHIGALGKENIVLKTENKTLRARLDELERWYGGNTVHR